MKDINDMGDVEYLSFIQGGGCLNEEHCARIQRIIDRLTVPEDLEEAGKKLYTLLYPSGDWKHTSLQETFKTLAAHIWPHLSTGLKPGDEVRVRDREEDKWVNRFYVGRTKNNSCVNGYICEDKEGNYSSWKFCEPIPKTQTYIILFWRIIQLAETGEFGWLEQGKIKYTRDGMTCSRSLEWLSDVCGKVYDPAFGFVPDIWKEEK